MTRNYNSTYELLPTHQCNQTDLDLYFKGANERQIANMNRPATFCLDDPNTLVLDGQNAGESGEFRDSRYLTIAILDCKGPDCLPQEEVI